MTFTIETFVNFSTQIEIRIKQKIWEARNGKFNRKTNKLIKIIKIKSYCLIWHLDNKKLFLSIFLFAKLLNCNIRKISQHVKNNKNWEKIKKIKFSEWTITKKIVNITKDDNILRNKECFSITTKPSFPINIIFKC